MLRREKPGAARENNMEGWVLLSRVVREDFPKEMTFRMRSQRWEDGASLVAQWLRICLLMQETRVRALVWEDPTCRGATRPVSHNY